jgi:Ca2+-binding RTX toxin-like protein
MAVQGEHNMPDNTPTPGDDNLYGTPDPDVIHADDGDDNIHGDGGNDELYGEGGNDFIAGGEGDDLIDGGADRDIVNYAEALDSVVVDLAAGTGSGADGNDTLVNIEDILGSNYNDLLIGDDNANMIIGNGGNDDIYGAGGDDNLIGEAGDDFLQGDDGSDHLLGGAGDDYMVGGDGTDTANYYAATGSVTVDLDAGTATGADGNDTLFNIENILGSLDYGDVLSGDDGDNHIDGLGGNDTIRGFGGSDTVDGGDGADFLNGGFGDDYIYGGDGRDRAAYYTANAAFGGVTVSLLLQGQWQNTGAQGNDFLTGIEAVSGTPFADTLTGDAGDNWLWGSAATISPGNISATNNDTLDGGDGNDLLTVGIGNHTLIGGSGIDTVRFTENGSPETNLTIFLGMQGIAQNTGNGSWTLTGIENLSGGIADDSFNGNFANNTLAGDLGSDVLNGGNGDDLLLGDGRINVDANGVITTFLDSGAAGGNDSLSGGNGNDTLYGGAGRDNLSGGNNNDTLYAGDGNDFLSGGTGDDLIDGGAGIDRASFFHSDAAAGGIAVNLNIVGPQNTGFNGVDTLVGIEQVSGTPFNDTLIGDDNDNWLWGSGAILNGITSPTNNDTIDGGGGNDLITVSTGNHILTGGTGIDTLMFNEPNSITLGVNVSLALQGSAQDTGQGSWTLDGFENLSGAVADDVLTGDANANILGGSLGNDVLSGGAGNDSLYGDGEFGIDNQGSGTGPIAFFADATTRYVGGFGGNDTLEGGDGDDQIFGGSGVDTASYASAGGSVQVFLYGGGSGEAFGAAGYDLLDGIENLTGSAFGDILFGDEQDNVLDGGGGQDELRGFDGNDTILGGAGDDFIVGGRGDDILNGGDGYDRAGYFAQATSGVTVDLTIAGPQNTGLGWDTLTGIENVSGTIFGDTLTGDDNDNWLWGSTAGVGSVTNNDTLSGGGGNDLLTVGYGNHLLDGGTGTDTLRYTENGGAENGLVLSLALQGAAQATGAGSWTFNAFENLSGSLSGDLLTGDGNANLLAGDSGNDTLVGGGGNDTLYGDGRVATLTGASGPITTHADVGTIGWTWGNDMLEGGLGNDTLDGGGGVDTATYAHASGGVTVNLSSGTASGADGNDTLSNIENLAGSEFNDILTGSTGANVIDGLSGNDTLQGHGGDDIIYGGDGNDSINGDLAELNTSVSGNDTIYAGNGNDVIRGGLGNDAMYGGANNDLMRGGGGVDSFDGGTDDGEGFNGIGDRVSFFEQLATQGVVADLRTGVISNDGFGNAETMVGIESLGGDTAYVDTFYGNDGRNYLSVSRGDFVYGFGGDDLLQVAAAAAVVDGGSGTDRLVLLSSGGWMTPDANSDGLAESMAAASIGWTVNLATGTTLDGYGNSGTVTGIENIDGSHLGDALTGDSGINVFNGFDGDDTLDGGLGNDTLDGGNGLDTASYANASGAVVVDLDLQTASGANGNDTLVSIENATGSAFNDTLIGDFNANVLGGGGGNDRILGNGGNDTIDGGAGADYITGGNGNDVIAGGAGNDRVGYYQTNAALGGATVSLLIAGAQNVGSQGMDTLSGVEHVSGTPFADTLTGDGGDNWLWGAAATISPGNVSATNNDTLNGGGGNDLLTVGIGNHTLIGGIGTDTVRFTENGVPVEAALTITLMTQGRAQTTGNGSWTLTSIENLSGGIGADKLTGDDFANVLAGDLGADNLIGNAGNDVLIGDGYINVDGSFVITTTYDQTGGGNDSLNGGKGDDFLYGGGGDDTMVGGQGIDRFVIQSNSGDDRLTDFALGVDKIVFDIPGGPDDFGDLVITRSGANVLISWGTTDSILIEGYRPSQITASSFEFGPPALALSAMAAQDSAKDALGGGFEPLALSHDFDAMMALRPADGLFL